MPDSPPARSAQPAADAVRHAVRRHLPQLAESPVRQLRRGGCAFAVGHDVIARVGDAATQAAVLAVAADRSTVAVPRPLFVDAEHEVLAYRRIPGVPVPVAELTAHAQSLGAFVNRLHGTFVGTVDRVVPSGHPADDDPSAALDAARERRRRLHADLSVAVRALLDRLLAGTAPERGRDRALCHLDLRPEHLLTDAATGEVTGVIDWGDAAIADPARDLAGVLVWLGPSMYDAVVAVYRGGFDDAARDRAALFARCLLLARIEDGLVAGDRAIAQDALRRLQRLPPPA